MTISVKDLSERQRRLLDALQATGAGDDWFDWAVARPGVLAQGLDEIEMYQALGELAQGGLVELKKGGPRNLDSLFRLVYPALEAPLATAPRSRPSPLAE
jgi:hypothetical protein